MKNNIKKLGLLAAGLVTLAPFARAADPVDLDALQTALSGKFGTIETIVISGFMLGAGIIVGMITLHWVNRGSRAKVK